jgi:hypothetical protein
MSKVYYWLGGVGAYLTGSVVMFVYLHNHELHRPIIGALLWPLRLLLILAGIGQ